MDDLKIELKTELKTNMEAKMDDLKTELKTIENKHGRIKEVTTRKGH